MAELFHASSDINVIAVEDKVACTAEIWQRRKQTPIKVGPITVSKRVSSVGCCDGIAAGYLALHSQGYDSITAVKAGLMECASIWQVEGVQEGMLSERQLFRKLTNTYDEC